MAEFVATLIALVSAGIKTATVIEKAIKNLRDAPSELLSLENEVAATNQILDRARYVLEQHRGRSANKDTAIEAHPNNFGHIIGRAIGYYVEIKCAVDSLSFEAKGGPLKHRNRLKWPKHKERLQKLQNGLRECRQEVVAFVGTENL